MSIARKIRRQQLTSTPYGKEPPVLIARPHKQEGWTCEATSQFLSKAFKRGIADYKCMESRTPDIARNLAITEFLHNPIHAKKTHLFFLDDDSTPCNDFVIERLLSLNKPVAAGVTPICRKKEAIDINKVRMLIAGISQNEAIELVMYWSPILMIDGKMEHIGIDELPKTPFIAHRTGGTCLLIRRDVLERLKPPYQKFEFDEQNVKLLRSEDFYFTDQIRQAGFEIWIDPESVCHHWHLNDILDMFSIAIQAKQQGYEQAVKEMKCLV